MPLKRSRELVRDLMLVGVATCPPETPIEVVARLILDKNLDAVIVLDKEDGHAVGVVNTEDLVQAYVQDNACSLRAVDVMREGIPQIPPDIPLRTAVQMLLDQKIRTFFVMHHAAGIIYPAASLSYQHILRLLAAQSEEDLCGLGVEAERKSPVEAYIEKRDAARRRVQSRRQE